MRKLIILILISLQTGMSAKNETDWDIFGLKNRVRTETSNTFLPIITDGKIEKGVLDSSNCNYISHYNKDGFLTQEIKFFYKMDIIEKCIYSYDKENQIEEICKYDQNGDMYSRVEYEWKDGFKLRETEYDDKDIIMKEIIYSNDSININGWKLYYQEGVVSNSYTQKWENGLMVEEKEYDNKGKLTNTQINHYKGKLLTGVEYISELGKESHTFEYDKNENIIQVKIKASGEPDQYIYYDYEYDRKRNWIKRIEYSGEKREPQTITESEFEYW